MIPETRRWQQSEPDQHPIRGMLGADAPSLLIPSVLLFLASLASLVYPYLLKRLVDASIGNGGPAHAEFAVIVLIAGFILATISGYISAVSFQKHGFLLRNRLRVRFFESVLYRPMKFHREEQVGELSSRATEDIGRLQGLYPNLLAPILQQTSIAAGCLVMMLSIDALAACAAVLLLASPLPFIIRNGRKVFHDQAEGTAAHAAANALLEEALVGIHEIQSSAREDEMIRRYARTQAGAMTAEMNAASRQAGMQQLVFLVLSFLLVGIYLIGTTGVLFPRWTPGDSIAFYLYAYTMVVAGIALGKAFLTYQGLSGAVRRSLRLLSYRAESAGTVAVPLRGAFSFQNITFGYSSGRSVLQDFSLEVREGEWILMTGDSGSGKSTIANLLLQFYRPGAGAIFFDGVDSRSYATAHLRRNIGYVAQEPFLFHGTLRENLFFTCPDASSDRLERVIRIACLEDVIRSVPKGLETMVGERGFTLSGGQKARVACARALLSDPPLLVLDEVNSMLDEELERLLWSGLEEERSGKTTLILSHHTAHIPRRARCIQLTRVPSEQAGSPG